MNLIDTHCHLNDPSFSGALADVIGRARAVGVTGFVVPAYDRDSLERTAQLAGLYPEVLFPAYGLHPWFIKEDTDVAIIRPHILREGTIAVGEIGLDFSSHCPPAAIQMPVFTRQLDMAADLGLPVLIHCRKAYDPLYRILGEYRGRVRGVLHSYSGGKDAMSRFLELGFYISFSGSVTRSNARKYHKVAEAVPLERMLLETDAPSIATESTVASEVEPRHVLEVAQTIATLRALPLSEVCRYSTENALRLFRILPRS
ncbi:MAG: TatD family hydrolase, partial [Syntrophales bacterium LBB04]|nr:TatD family hydrolase [Syntrophales bacterium LBB04]